MSSSNPPVSVLHYTGFTQMHVAFASVFHRFWGSRLSCPCFYREYLSLFFFYLTKVLLVFCVRTVGYLIDPKSQKTYLRLIVTAIN